MGPLAGVGDHSGEVVAPLLLVFFTGLAIEGNVIAPILYSGIFYTLYYGVGYWLLNLGYYKGSETILDLMESGIINKVITGAGILGNAVIGGLVANYVSVSTAIRIEQAEGQIFELQTSLFDQIMPGMLPLALTLLCYWLLKKGVSSVKVILIVAAVGVIGGLTGIL